MKVIFNADDFGLHPSISQGILESVRRGVVRSTTVLANVIPPEEKKMLAELKAMNGTFGIHLCLTLGKPLSPFPQEFLTSEGSFNRERLLSPMGFPRLTKEAIFRELSAQVESLLLLKPAHLDSHHHIHSFWNVLEVAEELALKLGLPMRALNRDMRLRFGKVGIRCPDIFIDDFFGKNNLSEELLRDCLRRAKWEGAGVVEVMCHPGFTENVPSNLSSYLEEREIELNVLTLQSLLEFLQEEQIEVVNYEAV